MVKPKTILKAAAKNDLAAVKQFVEVDNVRPAEANRLGQTAAHVAAEKGNLEIVRYLLAKDPTLANVSDGWSQTLLHIAVQSGSIELVKFLVEEYKANPEQSMGEAFGDSSVHGAAEKGHLHIFRYFVEECKADVNLYNHLGQPPAFTAALHARTNIVKYIVEERRANVTVVDSLGGNILYKSAKKGDLDVPKYLLDERNISFNVNNRDTFGETIIHRATRLNHVKFVKYFVEEKHANVNVHDHGGRTPLHLAAGLDSLTLVKLLVKNGADVLARNVGEETAVQETENAKVKEYLEREAKKRTRRDVSPLPASIALSSAPRPSATAFVDAELIRRIEAPAAAADHSPFVNIVSRYVDNFLTLANAVVDSNRRRHRALRYEIASLSPAEILLQKRIDPLAVEAVQRLRLRTNIYD